MSLGKRFIYYLGGFGIGIILVIFFLSGKQTSCNYFPNARVLEEIKNKKQVISPVVYEFLEENNLDTLALTKVLGQGKVKFGESQTDRHRPCRVYLINGKYQSQDLQVEVTQCQADSLAVISAARFLEKKK